MVGASSMTAVQIPSGAGFSSPAGGIRDRRPSESNPLLDAASFDRERAVRTHVGDYVLFMKGLFPESLAGRRRFGQVRLDAFVDYVKAGRESYGVVAAFDQFEYREEAPLFHRLTDNFELCVFGLNLVKDDLERSQRTYYRGLREALEG
jgi:hypothetical protein